MPTRKVAVIAIGGNSLILSKDAQTVQDQYRALCVTGKHIVSLVELGYQVVVTYGNGPQVGFLLWRSEVAHATSGLHGLPLVTCVADTQGGIGYQIQQTLKNEFLRRENPSWVLREDAGRGFRRYVPSPRPLEIVEEAGLKTLLASGLHLIAGGGGGIPVFRTEGGYEGVDAVVDKDLTSCLLAKRIKSDLFVISTAVSNVAIHFGTPEQENISRMTVAEAMACVEAGYFAPSGQPARRPSSPRRKTSAPRSWKARGRISSPDRCPIFREDGCLPRLARLGNAPEGFMRRKNGKGLRRWG